MEAYFDAAGRGVLPGGVGMEVDSRKAKRYLRVVASPVTAQTYHGEVRRPDDEGGAASAAVMFPTRDQAPGCRQPTTAQHSAPTDSPISGHSLIGGKQMESGIQPVTGQRWVLAPASSQNPPESTLRRQWLRPQQEGSDSSPALQSPLVSRRTAPAELRRGRQM